MIEIITIGDELLSGSTADANAAMIARELLAAGVSVQRFTSVGDRPGEISRALLALLPETKFVVCTGGLGPTEDDRTAEAAAAAFGDELALNREALALMEAHFAGLPRAMNASQQKQALLPSSCAVIPNPTGTACGFIMQHAERHYLFLPGVPAEACAMTQQFVVHYITTRLNCRQRILSRTLRVFGLWESVIQEQLKNALPQLKGVSLGYYPHFPDISLKITARGTDETVLEEGVRRYHDAIHARIGPYIYADSDKPLPEVVGRLLAERGETLAIAESCTGGLISSLITDVPGSSGYFNRGLVVYSNEAKHELAAVPQETIAAYGAVSEQTARALAEGVRTHAGTTYGLAVTGIAGPGGGTPEKPVGTVYLGLAGPDGCSVQHRLQHGNRERIKHLTAYSALDFLRRALVAG